MRNLSLKKKIVKFIIKIIFFFNFCYIDYYMRGKDFYNLEKKILFFF
jgi:hypothetical protein